ATQTFAAVLNGGGASTGTVSPSTSYAMADIGVMSIEDGPLHYVDVNSSVGATDGTGNYDNHAATGENAIAIGPNASATQVNTTAIGMESAATSNNSTAIGYKNSVGGDVDSTA